MDIGSTNGVHEHLTALEKKGFLCISESKSRGIVLTDKARELYGLRFEDEPSTRPTETLRKVVEIIDGFPESIDLSTSSGALQGADTVVRVMQKAILDGLRVPKGLME